MRSSEFRTKYGISLESRDVNFYDIYITREGFDRDISEVIHLWNPAKILNMIRDLPIVDIKRDQPDLHVKIMYVKTKLEHRIEWLKTNKPKYYEYQVKPHLST